MVIQYWSLYTESAFSLNMNSNSVSSTSHNSRTLFNSLTTWKQNWFSQNVYHQTSTIDYTWPCSAPASLQTGQSEPNITRLLPKTFKQCDTKGLKRILYGQPLMFFDLKVSGPHSVWWLAGSTSVTIPLSLQNTLGCLPVLKFIKLFSIYLKYSNIKSE